MLSKVVYKKLFGIFNYEIELKEQGVTIITGPNGFGKSTILKTINALYSFDIFFFLELDFHEIEFFSSDSKKGTICIQKINDQKLVIDNYEIDTDSIYEEVYRKIRRPFFSRLDNEKLINRRTEEIIYKKDFIKSSLSERIREEVLESVGSDNIELLTKLKDFSGKTKFIKEQRLLKVDNEFSSDVQTINVIEELPQKFKHKINIVSTRYSDEANKLDSTYPNRLFKTKVGISKDEYEDRIPAINEKFTKLKKYNIYDVQGLDVPGNVFENEFSKALKIYLDDFEKKYNVFDEFIEE